MEAKEFEMQILERTEENDISPLCILEISAVKFAVALSDGFIEIANRDIMSNINPN